MNEKIQPHHLDRSAYVYVRQSTMHQVRNSLESQRRQYALVQLAQEKNFHRVEVIDEDLGRSGSGSQERPGFERLLGAVCRGEVGAVLALEASRLARNNRDWHYLLDLCAMTETLVIDHEGVYDPRRPNDRLLLGLKGTMSEFELDLLRQRAQEARRDKIRRGEVLTQVPIGYIRTEHNGMEMIPDRQVQEAIRGIFSKFQELGSIRQVLLWYRQQEIPLPTFSPESGNDEVVWQLPVYGRLFSILTHPAYAGAFAHGRSVTKTVIVEGRARKTKGHSVPRDQWEVLIRDHHAGHISWDTYVKNQVMIEANAGMCGKMETSQTGAAKAGPALLSGLLRCGRCGRKLHVGYSGNGGRVPRYYCRGAHLNHGTERCISFGGLRVDEAVVREVLETLQPLGVQSALDAWDALQQDQDHKGRALTLALEKARYDAQRIQRQYDATDPENRLVAGELEKRWDRALQKVAELETRLNTTEAHQNPVVPEQRQHLLHLGQGLNILWQQEGTSVALKKRILRTVLHEIIVDITAEPAQITMKLHWVGGSHTDLTIAKNRTGMHRHMTDRQVIDLVRELAKVCPDPSIAAILNRLGYRTGADNGWTEPRVRSLRSYHEIPAYDPETPRSWLTLNQAAEMLQVSPNSVRKMIRREILPAKQIVPHAPWVIPQEALQLSVVQKAARMIREGRGVPRLDAENAQLLLFQARREV
ncbi:MAG TPA: recombinase family protein [Sedimentisphaerales bacterium]|nr:recombinase family protein [Sedimentisphaerales bacterium]